MLAEQAFSIDKQLPAEMLNTAYTLAGELAWPASEALQVVQWLGKHGCAVVGVEMWQEKDGQPLWIAASDYSPRSGAAMTSDTIARCALQAASFITKHRNKPGALFNLAWEEILLPEMNKAKAA